MVLMVSNIDKAIYYLQKWMYLDLCGITGGLGKTMYFYLIEMLTKLTLEVW